MLDDHHIPGSHIPSQRMNKINRAKGGQINRANPGQGWRLKA
jgi:hypothetical protein